MDVELSTELTFGSEVFNSMGPRYEFIFDPIEKASWGDRVNPPDDESHSDDSLGVERSSFVVVFGCDEC